MGRLIPACAGKTTASTVASDGRAGSSPHARGKLRQAGRRPQRERLIPACAGKTNQHGAPISRHWAHPRMRGENAKQTAEKINDVGSSPHARGKHDTPSTPSHPQGSSPHARGKHSLTWINTEQSSQLDTTYHASLLI